MPSFKSLQDEPKGPAGPEGPAGPGIVAGIIAMWSGTIATIPTGWALCNGANGTPDLRDRFVVGAKQDDAGVAKTNVEGILLQSSAPKHGHGTGTEGTGHEHSLIHDGMPAQPGEGQQIPQSTTYDGVHGHTTTADAAIPVYFALAYIMKL